MARRRPRDAKACYYCGEPATSVDHVIPRKALQMLRTLNDSTVTEEILGGRVLLVPACRECNSALGATIDLSLLNRRRRAKEHIINKYFQYLNMPNWSDKEISEKGYSLRQLIIRGQDEKARATNRLRYKGGVGKTYSFPNAYSVATNSTSNIPHKSIVQITAGLKPTENVELSRSNKPFKVWKRGEFHKCLSCGDMFLQHTPNQRYCSPLCQQTDISRNRQRILFHPRLILEILVSQHWISILMVLKARRLANFDG